MTPAKFSSTYLVRNPFSYCFRMAVPKDLQPSFGKKELRYSLKTRYLNDAENMARLMAGNIKMIFHGLRRGDPSLKDLTPELVNQLVKKHHREALEYYKKPINPFSNDKESYDYYLAHKIKTAQDLKIQIDALEFFQDEYKFQLATGKYDEVDSKAQELLEEANVQYDKNSELYCN